MVAPTRRVVIARYKEDLSWVHALTVPYTVYNKGPPLADGAIEARSRVNVGNESETYLAFIIEAYDDLEALPMDSDVAFCQGMPFDHNERVMVGFEPGGFDTYKGGAQDLINFLNHFSVRNHFTPLGAWYSCDLMGRPHFDMDMRAELEHLGLPVPPVIWFVQGGQFIVSASRIRQRPKAFYERLLRRAHEFGFFRYGYFCERLWAVLFA